MRSLLSILAAGLLLTILFSLPGESGGPWPLLPREQVITRQQPDATSDSRTRRLYQWKNSRNETIQTRFEVSEEVLEEVWSNYGLSRGMTHIRYFKKQGFIITRNILMVDYPGIYQRNLARVDDFARDLYRTGKLQGEDRILPEFLRFVQQIEYRLPPMYMRGKKIMEFFPPLICLEQGYGDCDSKVILLADLVSTLDGGRNQFAIVILNIYGKPHMLLAVKADPLVGMTAINIAGHGVFLPIETSVPGYYPGFISQMNREWLMDENTIIQLLN